MIDSTLNHTREPLRSRVSAALAKALSVINLSGAVIVGVTLTLIFLVIFVNVIARYFFENGFTWAYEVPSILFPWAVAGGIVMAASQGRNISVDMFINALPSKFRRAIYVGINLFLGFVSASVVIYSMPIVMSSRYSRLAETGIPQIYGYSSIMYAFSFVCLVSVITAIEYMLGRDVYDKSPSENNFS
ncbi:TRAP transporter small permease [Oceanobacter kriegii]|uniref:TRAP transporter small permease n=1 Tax=Oceanobacter kriegii TaxID=64972 RepID=UPI00146A92E4|nr:TRAP transporter small permease [Oceanobacter kriegii]